MGGTYSLARRCGEKPPRPPEIEHHSYGRPACGPVTIMTELPRLYLNPGDIINEINAGSKQTQFLPVTKICNLSFQTYSLTG